MVNQEDADKAGRGMSARALQTIEGERKAAEYMSRLLCEEASPDDLALTVAPLYGAELRGFCAALTKALRAAKAGGA